MRKIFVLIILCFSIIVGAEAQTLQASKSSVSASLDSLVHLANGMIAMQRAQTLLNSTYKLYKTQNMYNFLKLNTSTGQIAQIQWSNKSSNEGTVDYINTLDLTSAGGEVPGRFELYPTDNIYTFLLLDTWTGSTWHVQWGMKSQERGIIKMY